VQRQGHAERKNKGQPSLDFCALVSHCEKAQLANSRLRVAKRKPCSELFLPNENVSSYCVFLVIQTGSWTGVCKVYDSVTGTKDALTGTQAGTGFVSTMKYSIQLLHLYVCVYEYVYI